MNDTTDFGLPGRDVNPAEQWRAAALAFEKRAMRVEYVIRLLVAGGHVTQDRVNQAFSIAKNAGGAGEASNAQA